MCLCVCVQCGQHRTLTEIHTITLSALKPAIHTLEYNGHLHAGSIFDKNQNATAICSYIIYIIMLQAKNEFVRFGSL